MALTASLDSSVNFTITSDFKRLNDFQTFV
jgi:hypothetical protein